MALPGVNHHPVLPTHGTEPREIAAAYDALLECGGSADVGANAVCVLRPRDLELFRTEEAASAELTRWTEFPAAAMNLRSVRGRLSSIHGIDGKAHAVVRRHISTAIHRALPTVEGIAESVCDAALERVPVGPIDIVGQLALPMAAGTMCRFMGIDDELAGQCAAWSYAVSELLTVGPISLREIAAAEQAYGSLSALLSDASAAGRLGRGMLNELELDALPAETAVDSVLFVFAAGLVAMTDFVADVLHDLLVGEPEVSGAWHDPELDRRARFEELLRIVTPVQMIYRVAGGPSDTDGCPVPSGTLLVLSLGAANRALARAEAGLESEPGSRRHYAFGYGSHRCAGAPVARAWGPVVIDRLRAFQPRLQGPVHVRWRRDLSLKGPASLLATVVDDGQSGGPA